MVLSSNSKQGSRLGSTIHTSKLEARLFFYILNVKGTPSREEHKNIVSGVSKIN
jgi:hypothetical protein